MFLVGGEGLRGNSLQPPKHLPRQKSKTIIKRSDIIGHIKVGAKLLHDAEQQKKQEEEMTQSLGDYTIVDLQSKILEMTVSSSMKINSITVSWGDGKPGYS